MEEELAWFTTVSPRSPAPESIPKGTMRTQTPTFMRDTQQQGNATPAGLNNNHNSRQTTYPPPKQHDSSVYHNIASSRSVANRHQSRPSVSSPLAYQPHQSVVNVYQQHPTFAPHGLPSVTSDSPNNIQNTFQPNTRYFVQQGSDGHPHYYSQGSAGFQEIDPALHGPSHSSQPRYQPSGPQLPLPYSHASPRTAVYDHGFAPYYHATAISSAHRSPTLHHTSHSTDEDLFDEMDADIDWDCLRDIEHISRPQGYNGTHRAPHALSPARELTRRGSSQLEQLQRQLYEERQRANVAESMLSRIHNSQPSGLHVDRSLTSNASDPISSPSARQPGPSRRNNSNGKAQAFEFDANFRQAKANRNTSFTDADDGTAENSPGQADLNTAARQQIDTWGLPETKHTQQLTRQSAYVPPITKAEGITKLSKTLLPDMYSSIFPFKEFNHVQSACYSIIMKTDENIVVTAPTGAGKTALFELAMIRLWQTRKDHGKIVYIAPTKSLCSERFRDWKQKYNSPLHTVKCVELTGDTHEGALAEAKTAKLIITTPEKWDSVTRNLRGGTPWYSDVKLFCIDEVHLLAEERGATLEVIVNRMQALGRVEGGDDDIEEEGDSARSKTPDMRFIAVSATVPNIEDVAVWLGAGRLRKSQKSRAHMARVLKFGDEFRPVPLQKFVHAYPCNGKADQAFDSTLNFKLLDLIERHASGKPVLIFCNTRKGCTTAATQILKDYNSKCQKRSGAPPWPIPRRAHNSGNFQDSALAELANVGVGVHHAGLQFADRKLTEDLFLKGGHIHVICTTSTLAVGINLPARMVIIKGTTIWDASQGKQVDYSDLDILQMMGRAGRPQFDTHGVAVIMCKSEEKDKYNRLAKSQTILESCLHKTLVEHINSEIATKTIKKVSDAYRWLRGTFLYVRIKQNPQHYSDVVDNVFDDETEDGSDTDSAGGHDGANMRRPETRLEELVSSAIEKLKKEGLVEEDEMNGTLASTSYGDMLCQYSIRFPTFLSLKNMESGATTRQLLAQLCTAVEFKDLKFRGGEKNAYTDLNRRDEMRWPLENVNDSADKVNILLQLRLGGLSSWELKVTGSNAGGESIQVLQHASRIASCLIDLATYKRDAIMSRSALEIARCLKSQCWEHNYVVLSQLEGVGPKIAKAFGEARINSFADVSKQRPETLDNIAKRTATNGFGKRVLLDVKRLPSIDLRLNSKEESIETGGVRVCCDISLRLTNDKNIRLHATKGNRKLTLSILVCTSDNVFIEWKRIKVSKLEENDRVGATFTRRILLTRPSQKIECYVTCEEMAGLNWTASLKPKTPSSKYPIPTGVFDEATDEEDERLSNGGGKSKIAPEGFPSKARKGAKTAPQHIPHGERLPNGNYKCRHTCEGSCRHSCCEVGLPRRPKGGKTDFVDGSSSEDEAHDKVITANKKKIEKPKPVRRSAQEIANSLKGAKDITATSIKLERVKRSPVPDKSEKIQHPPWLKASLNALDDDHHDDDDDEDLPTMRALVENAKRKSQKRARETSKDEEENSVVPPTKVVKVEEKEAAASFERSPTIGRPMPPRCRSQTLMPDIPRRPLSPARFSHRVMASPPLSPVKEGSKSVSTRGTKQPLFRPPSPSERKQKEKVKHTVEDPESDIDELQSSSA